MRLIDADALIDELPKEYLGSIIHAMINEAPTIEPNLILPERMERGDIYEVGETIVVMNHDDYYDLLCKSWVPNSSEKPNNCDTCMYNDLQWYSEVCDECSKAHSNYEPKDEPQTCDNCTYKGYITRCRNCHDWSLWERFEDEPQIRCPNCGRTDYIRSFEKDFGIKDSGYKYKCINCNTYIKDEPNCSEKPNNCEPQTERGE